MPQPDIELQPAFKERFGRANKAALAGRLEEAELAYRALADEDPRSAALFCKLGDVLLRMKRYDQAHAALQRSIALDDTLVWSHITLARLHQAEGRLGLALAALEAAQAVDPLRTSIGAEIEALRLREGWRSPTRILVADGTEDIEGRALLLISALHVAAPRLGPTLVRFVAARSDAVLAAIECLQWDRGIETAVCDATPAALDGASGYAAVAFRSMDHLDPCREAALQRGLGTVIAVQFPDRNADDRTLALQAVAHDPCRLAENLVTLRESAG